jgi:hypothetical protein
VVATEESNAEDEPYLVTLTFLKPPAISTPIEEVILRLYDVVVPGLPEALRKTKAAFVRRLVAFNLFSCE